MLVKQLDIDPRNKKNNDSEVFRRNKQKKFKEIMFNKESRYP